MLGNVGFQLSFLVTAGLILGVPPVRAWLPNGHRTKALFDLIAVTMVAQAISFPLTVYYFNQFHLLSLMANFVLVPFISLVMPLGGASLILDALWHPAGSLVAMAAELANNLTFGLVQKLSRLKSFRMIWATPPLQWVLYMYAALALCLGTLKRAQANRVASFEARQHSKTSLQTNEDMPTQPLNAISDQPLDPSYLFGSDPRHTSIGRKWIPFIALFALVLPLVWAYYPDWDDHAAYVSFIDVGQGDSILVRTASGKHILIDGGGAVVFRKPGDEWRERSDPFEVGQKVVVPLLQQRGVHDIDLLVLSHLHSDHIKGLIAVLGQIPVKRILWNGTFMPSADAISVLQASIDQHIPLYTAAAGLSWQMDDHTVIEVIGSASGITDGWATPIPTIKEQNGQSVALLLHLYGRSILLAGDADEAEEQALLSQYQSQNHPQKQAIDVLKVSHHGSKTSSSAEWLSYWQPNMTVISVGRNNPYGHPNRNVLQRIEAIGAGVKRTDLNGEVQFRITSANRAGNQTKAP